MNKKFLVTIGLLALIISAVLLNSCNDDEVPIDTTPLIAEPTSVTVATGTTGFLTVSGGVTPYSIQTAPDALIATAAITTFGAVTISPVSTGSTSITVQDNSEPPRSVTVPITVTVGYGTVHFAWSINGQSPVLLCAQVNSSQVRVTVDGYDPITRLCGESEFTIDSITAGNHTVTAELLNSSMTVLSSITQNIYITANQATAVSANFNAPLIIGSFHTTWTINGQPAGSGCGMATSMKAVLGGFAPMIEPCSNGQFTMHNIPQGTYTFVAELLDAGNTTLSQFTQSVVITASQTTNLNFNFTIGPLAGDATINWAINGGQNCTPGGNISITATGPSAGIFNASCSDYSYQLSDLGPGTYTFDVVLTDPSYPGQQATAQAQNVIVEANNNSVVSLNLNCLFCGGVSSTGWVQVDVSCGGAACGLTGTLYVIIKDCGSGNVALNTDDIPGTTLSAGSPTSHTVANVLSGGRCVVVFLDVDGNGQLSSGDAVSTLGEQNFVLPGGETTTVSVMLDSVNP